MEENYEPRFPRVDGWEKGDGESPSDQQFDLQWWRPRYGCDSLQMALEGATDRERARCAAICRELTLGYPDPAVRAALLRAAERIEEEK